MICEQWEGLTVDKRFPLLEWLGGWADRCVFLTVRQGTQKANIKLIVAGGPEADAQIARWEAAKSLSHASLVQMMETGRYKINDSDVVFVLTEKTEAILSGIIPRKALDAGRVKEILGPVVDALAFLHEKGLAHGCVKPSRIVEVGDHWKLVSDEMVSADELANKPRELDTYDAPELTAAKLTTASDLWSLGIIIIESFAQRTPVWDRTANGDLGVPDFIPEPFRGTARECLRWEPEKRISISDVKARLASVKAVAVPESLKQAATPVAQPVKEAVTPQVPQPLPAEQVQEPVETHAIREDVKPDVEPSKPIESVTGPLFASLVANTAAETHTAPVEESWKEPERWNDPPASESEQESVPQRSLFGVEEESAELTPRSRMFANLEEEESGGRSWTSVIVVLLLLVAGAAVVHYRSAIRAAVDGRMGSKASQSQPAEQQAQSSTTQPAPSQPPAQSPSPTASSNDAGTKAAEPPAQNAPSTEAKTTPPAKEPAPKQEALPAEPESKPVERPAAKPANREHTPTQAAQTPSVSNAKGAVLDRVMPNVAPGASAGMRGPIEVELRVSVDPHGRVANAEYLTQGPGNYFARVAHDAARSWKFKAPVSDGEATESQWILLFKFQRGHTEVTASQVH